MKHEMYEICNDDVIEPTWSFKLMAVALILLGN